MIRTVGRILIAAGLLAAVCEAQTAPGRSFAIRAKAVYPVTPDQPGAIERGMVIVRDGKIVAVGSNLEIPADLPLIDLRDEVICPGFVNAASGVVGPHEGDDSVSGAYAAIDAFDRYGRYADQLALGTTTAHLSPGGHRLVSGRGAVVKLGGPSDARILKAESDLAINLGVFNPPTLVKAPFYASSDVAIEPARWQRPASRLGQLLELDERIASSGEGTPAVLVPTGVGTLEAAHSFDFHGRAFSAAWKSGLPLRIQVRRAADIASAIAFSQKHKRPAVLVGVSEGDELAAALLDAALPLVLRIENAYRFPDFNAGADPAAFQPDAGVAARVAAAGAKAKAAKLALAGMENDPIADLQTIGTLAVRGGLSMEAALAAITRTAAEVLGVESRLGSLAPGKDADFVVLSAAPLSVESRVLRTYVNGELAYEALPPDRGNAVRPLGARETPRPIVVRAGTIWIGNGQVISDGSLLIENGKIKAVGQRVPRPPLARVIDAGRDAFVTPGFIDAHGHLGLEEWRTAPDQRTAATPDLAIHRTIGVAGRDFLRVAQAGVTTVLLAAYRTADNGSRIAAVKTFGDRDEMVTREVAGMKFSLAGKDPIFGVNAIKEAIEAAKKYEESWKKYAEELDKWKKDREKGVEAKPKDSTEEKVEDGKPDPITGTWEFKLTGGPLPEPISGSMTLKLMGTKIEGKATAPGGDQEASLVGTLEGKQVTMEIDEDIPMGKPKISATLDREDHMQGSLKIGEMLSLDFEANRTDKSPVEFKVERRKKTGKDGRPEPPQVNENLEPLRPLLAGKAAALVEVRTAAETLAALKLFVDTYKIPTILLDAPDAADVADELVSRKESIGVVVPPQVMRRRDDVRYNQAADLASRGVRIAMQSDSEDGARALPLMGLYAVREGLGGDDALRSLTVDAAKLFKLDDRIGTLEAGKDADILIHTGHPFDTGSRIERIIIGGQEVPDDN